MKKMKWSALVLVLILLTAIISACAGRSNSNNEGNSGNQATVNVDQKPAVQKPVELSMLITESLLGGIHQQLVDKFEAENPNIKVKVETVPSGNIYETLRIRITSNEVPDFFNINIGNDTTLLAEENGYLTDLSDMESMKNYAESIRSASVINGKVVNFSLGAGVLGFSYNKKMLADAGYDAPPKTWEELMDLGKKLKESGKDMLVYASKWETGIGNVFHWAFGAQANKDAAFKKAYLSNTIDWSVPEYRAILEEGFKRFKELNQFVRVGSFTNEFPIAQQAFTAGDTAMSMGGTWEAGKLRTLNPELDWSFMNLPYSDDAVNPYIFVPEDGVALNAKSKHPEEAKKFLNWLFSKETYAQIQKAKGSMSAVNGVGELDPAYSEVPQWLNTNKVISFANTGPIPNPTWVALGQAAQKYTFDNKLEDAMKSFINAYEGTKRK